MSERKNIDKLFQEKFKDFEHEAPENAWPELERRLKEKEDRKIIPIWWWRLGGIAAALLIGFLIADRSGMFGDKNQIKNDVVIDDNRPTNPTKDNPSNIGSENPSSDAMANADSDSTATNSNPMVDVPRNDGSGEKTQDVSNQTGKNSNGNFKSIPQNDAIVNADKNQKSPNRVSNKKQNSIRNIDANKSENAVATTNAKQKSGNENVSDNYNDPGLNNKNQSVAESKQKRSLKKTDPKIESVETKKPTNDELGLEPRNNRIVHQQNIEQSAKDKAIAEKNKNDQKSSEAATLNQKAELNLNTTNNINPVAVAEDNNQKKLDSTATAMTVPNALEELLHEKENKVTKEPKINRWQLTSNVAPIYFGSTSGGSPIDSTFANNSKDYNTQVSYGLGVQYAINKKLTIRTGVNKVSLSYDTNDVQLYAGLNNGGLDNVDVPAQSGALNFGRPNTQSRNNASNRTNTTAATGDLSTDKFSGSINQKMGYIEVPLELAYTVVDRKFGVNIIAGVSTLFLNDNQIKLTSDGLTTDLGEANNLNKTHFSSNIGLGLKYKFLKSFEANFEPIFKYQISTFSKDSGDFKPYFFGLYSGISFRF